MKTLSECSLVVCFVFVLFFAGFISGQDKDKDWRPITPEELASKKPVVEADADAEAIFWEIRIGEGDDLTMKHYVRVKIYNERGREKYSKFDVEFVKGIQIKDLAARITRPDGSSTEIQENDIFEREIIKISGLKVRAKSFAVPNIEPGVIIEYRYKEVISDAGARGMSLPFQREIPVQKLVYYYKPYNKSQPDSVSYNFNDTKWVKDKDGYWMASRTDVPAFRSEPHMQPADNVRAWMLLIPPFTFNYTGSPQAYWRSVGARYAAAFVFMFGDNPEIQKAAAEVTAGATSNEEKLKKLYNFCQTQIANTTFDTSITNEQRAKLPKIKDLADVLRRRSAPWYYIDYLFGAMAKASGFDTRIAYTADRSKMLVTPDDTNERLLHVAAIAINVNNAWTYFKPGYPFLPYGTIPWTEQEWAFLVGETRYDWSKNPLTDHSASVTKRTGKFTLLEDGTLEGTVELQLNGQPALLYRWDNYDEQPQTREENLIQEVKRRISTAEVSKVSIENLSDNTKPLIKKYTIRVPNYSQKTGKRLFVQPGFFEYGENPVFSSSTRKYDIFFQYPWSEQDHVEITYPKNFEPDNADAPGNVSDPSKICLLDIKIGVSRTGGFLNYDRHFHFGGNGYVLFGVSNYQSLKGLFDAFHTADSHTITLKQK
jgi:hypothetical protein